MSFSNLNRDELLEVVEFFVVDVDSADPEKPSKKELVAALAAGDDPVTWDQYKEIFLKAKESGQHKNDEVEREKKEAEEAAKARATEAPVEEVDTSDYVLIKYDRQNPTYEIVGYTFNKRHPFASVPPETAEYLVRNVEGFRLALPSEVADYYN